MRVWGWWGPRTRSRSVRVTRRPAGRPRTLGCVQQFHAPRLQLTRPQRLPLLVHPPRKGAAVEIAGVGERMARWRVCRSCDFWLTCLGYRALGDQDPDGRRVLRADGRHYMT